MGVKAVSDQPSAVSPQPSAVGLALGGGAVRGLAHVGVLTVLEREGIPIHCVAGASVGSVIGAIYCATGDIEPFRELARTVRWRDVARPTWPVRGWITFERLERWLAGLVGDLSFDELRLPFACVATDLESGEPVVLREGRVAAAVRASCSIPGLVAPVRRDGRWLGDGGVSDNLPVAATRAVGADYVIGVDICLPTYRGRWGPFGVGFSGLESAIRNAGGGVRSADCLITPDLAGFSYVRFTRRDELIARGAAAAEAALPRIRAALADND
jgi:NTE family protein